MSPKFFASSFGSPFHHLAARAAATAFAPFPQIIWLKLPLLSTSTAVTDRPTGYPEANNTCPLSDFLLNNCGLSLTDFSTILRRRPCLLRTRSTHTAQQAVRLLRDSGFTENQVRKIITRNPPIIFSIAERRLKPKLEFMKTLGVAPQDIRNVICRYPRFLGCSLEKTLFPNIQYLQNLVGSEADVSKVFETAPEILVISNGPEILEKKLKHLASFGLQEDETRELVRRTPRVLLLSMDKMEKIMGFFIHTAGISAKYLLTTCPVALTYSLEGRIKPRHKVLKSISEMQPSKPLPSLSSALSFSEQVFLKRFVNCSPNAAKLLEIYSGKPVDLDSIH